MYGYFLHRSEWLFQVDRHTAERPITRCWRQATWAEVRLHWEAIGTPCALPPSSVTGGSNGTHITDALLLAFALRHLE